MARMEVFAVAFVIAVVLLASTTQTLAGFGFALVAVPMLIIALTVRDTVVTVSLLALLNSTLVARATWAHVPWRTVGTMLAGSFAGMPIGLAVLLLAPVEALRLAVGIVSVTMAAAIMLGARLGAGGVRGELIAGMTSGVLNTSTSMNGPPVVLYLQDRGYPPIEFRAALATFFFVTGVVSLAAFAISGIVSGRALALAALGVPAVFLGNALGHALFGRVAPELFRTLVLALLAVTAAVTIATTLAGIAG